MFRVCYEIVYLIAINPTDRQIVDFRTSSDRCFHALSHSLRNPTINVFQISYSRRCDRCYPIDRRILEFGASAFR